MRPRVLGACAAVLTLVGIAALTADREPAPAPLVAAVGPASPPIVSTAAAHVAPATTGTAAGPRGIEGLTGDDLPDLPAGMHHLADLDLAEAMADAELPRSALRQRLAGEARADLVQELTRSGRSPDEVATIAALLDGAWEQRLAVEQQGLEP